MLKMLTPVQSVAPLYLRVLKFNPAQARVPEGSEHGGEFAKASPTAAIDRMVAEHRAQLEEMRKSPNRPRQSEVDQVGTALFETAKLNAPLQFAKGAVLDSLEVQVDHEASHSDGPDGSDSQAPGV
jgi:hypothetical protein